MPSAQTIQAGHQRLDAGGKQRLLKGGPRQHLQTSLARGVPVCRIRLSVPVGAPSYEPHVLDRLRHCHWHLAAVQRQHGLGIVLGG